MMAVRVLCFILMVFVQPFGWWTWVFGAGAIFLPYIAVVLANVGEEGNTTEAVPPERQLEAPVDHAAGDAHEDVITVQENRERRDGDGPPKDDAS